MKTFYSSTFLSMVLGFLMLMGQNGQEIVIVQDENTVNFRTIIEPSKPAEPRADGLVKVEVFNTFSCQSCKDFTLGALRTLREKYAENKEVEIRLYVTPNKEDAGELYSARGVHCAAPYDRFWHIGEEFAKADALSEREVDLIGQAMELPLLEFRNCIKGDSMDAQIDADIAYAAKRGIIQRPTIMVNDTMMLGAQPIENIERIVNKYLQL